MNEILVLPFIETQPHEMLFTSTQQPPGPTVVMQ